MEVISKNKTFKDIFLVAFSNIISILSSLLTGFVIPIILGVQDYGYYRTFALYTGYIGIFSFGFHDGILLNFAGKTKEELDKKNFITYTNFYIILEAIVSFIIIIISLFFLNYEYKFIFLCLSLNLFFQNVMSYYQFILQCTQQFKEYSIKNIVLSILTSLCVGLLWIVYRFINIKYVNFKIYIILLLCVYFILTIWFFVRFRKITFGRGTPIKEAMPAIKKIFYDGIPLLIANLCSGLILSIDSQFVNIYFSNDIFAIYSFAYSILGLVTKLISAVTIVIYPTLKKATFIQLKDLFPNVSSLLIVFISFSLIMFFPLELFINIVMPKYNDSLIIFRIILPGLIISSIISVIIQNYYKTINKSNLFFIFSAVTLGISFVLNIGFYYFFRTTTAISWASIITLILYYFITIIPLAIKMKIKFIKNTSYMLFIIFAFYLCTFSSNILLNFLLFLSIVFGLTLLFYINKIKEIMHLVKNKLNNNKKMKDENIR